MGVLKLITITCLISFTFFISFIDIFAQVNSKSVSVKGYYNKNGTYVQPYHRTAPNSTNRDNYSTKGNVNPYTGKQGTVNPDNKNNNYQYKSTSSHDKDSYTSTSSSVYNNCYSEGKFYLSGNLGANSRNEFSSIDSYGFSFGYFKRDYRLGFIMELFANDYTIDGNIGLLYPTKYFMVICAIGFGDINYGDTYNEQYKLNGSFGFDLRISRNVSIPIRYETIGGMLLSGIAYNFDL